MSCKKYYIWTIGCQMNKSDAERVAATLEAAGHKKAGDEKSADLIVVVACSVRQSAVDRIFGKARLWQARREKGELRTVLTGCVLDTDKKKLMPFFDLILPIGEVKKLKVFVETRFIASQKGDGDAINRVSTNFSAYVPIMTGCNNFCSYCVVPYVRGREISRPAEEIIAECRDLVKRGYKEIILIGQNVNSYRSDSPLLVLRRGIGGGLKLRPHPTRSWAALVAPRVATSDSRFARFCPSQGDPLKTRGGGLFINFPQLLQMIDSISGDYWLRFATSHPKDLSDELIKVMASGKHLTPYLHLPIQAGDNQILKKMNRGYTVAHYKNLIKKVRKAIPNIAVSTDIIVGFPSEGKKQFKNTVKLFKGIKFDMAYIAQYSPRAGTVAAKFKDDVSKAEKKRRWNELNELLKKTALAANKKLVGKTVKVLVEDFKKKCVGKTDAFKSVIFSGDKSLVGQFMEVKITKAGSWGLSGEKIKSNGV